MRSFRKFRVNLYLRAPLCCYCMLDAAVATILLGPFKLTGFFSSRPSYDRTSQNCVRSYDARQPQTKMTTNEAYALSLVRFRQHYFQAHCFRVYCRLLLQNRFCVLGCFCSPCPCLMIFCVAALLLLLLRYCARWAHFCIYFAALIWTARCSVVA